LIISFFCIASIRVAGFNENISIILEDLVADSLICLEQDSSLYCFNATFNDPPDRFRLHFTQATAIEAIQKNEMIKVYSSGSNIYLTSNSTEGSEVQVMIYDLQGRKCFDEHLLINGTIKINTGLSRGYYLIDIPGSIISSEKLIIK
jgi:hypothetical protein